MMFRPLYMQRTGKGWLPVFASHPGVGAVPVHVFSGGDQYDLGFLGLFDVDRVYRASFALGGLSRWTFERHGDAAELRVDGLFLLKPDGTPVIPPFCGKLCALTRLLSAPEGEPVAITFELVQ